MEELWELFNSEAVIRSLQEIGYETGGWLSALAITGLTLRVKKVRRLLIKKLTGDFNTESSMFRADETYYWPSGVTNSKRGNKEFIDQAIRARDSVNPEDMFAENSIDEMMKYIKEAEKKCEPGKDIVWMHIPEIAGKNWPRVKERLAGAVKAYFGRTMERKKGFISDRSKLGERQKFKEYTIYPLLVHEKGAKNTISRFMYIHPDQLNPDSLPNELNLRVETHTNHFEHLPNHHLAERLRTYKQIANTLNDPKHAWIKDTFGVNYDLGEPEDIPLPANTHG